MKKFILIAIIICLLIPVLTLADKKYEEEVILYNFLQDLGGEYVESDVSVNISLGKGFLGEKEMREIGDTLINILGIQGKELDPYIKYHKIDGNHYFKEFIFEHDYSQIIYSGYDKGKNQITGILSSYLDNKTGIGESFIYINIVKKEHFFMINDIIKEIESEFNLDTNPLDVTSSIMGIYRGELKYKQVENKVHESLKELKGKVIEEFKDESIISYTAYTPYIDKYITINENKLNLNIAIRYNNYEDKTYIWIGTPIITNGF